MDSANPDPKLIAAILRVSEQVPELRIVIDHLPHAVLPEDRDELTAYWANLNALGKNPRVFVKLSEIPVRVNGRVPTEVSFYRSKLDRIWDIFGEDRILFGSDWPNSDHVADYEETFGIVRAYVAEKGGIVEEKFFWRNSVAAYRWHPRDASQRSLSRAEPREGACANSLQGVGSEPRTGNVGPNCAEFNVSLRR